MNFSIILLIFVVKTNAPELYVRYDGEKVQQWVEFNNKLNPNFIQGLHQHPHVVHSYQKALGEFESRKQEK